MEEITKATVSRRSVLSGLLAGLAVGTGGTAVASAGSSSEETALGTFESGFDGWGTNGGNELSRIDEDDAVLGIVDGSFGLEVTVNGDTHPMIENKERVKAVDFVSNPYLVCHVLPTLVSGTDSDLTFQFRLHYSNGNGGRGGRDKPNGKGEGKAKGKKGNDSHDSNQKPVLVEESPEMQVSTLQPVELAWDLSDISEAKRAAATRLEITWYPTEHPPQRGARGNANGFTYDGGVVFDGIRVTDVDGVVSQAAFRRNWIQLLYEHGRHVETAVESSTDNSETGTLVFGSGTELPYTFDIIDGGNARLSIDGDVYEFTEEAL